MGAIRDWFEDNKKIAETAKAAIALHGIVAGTTPVAPIQEHASGYEASQTAGEQTVVTNADPHAQTVDEVQSEALKKAGEDLERGIDELDDAHDIDKEKEKSQDNSHDNSQDNSEDSSQGQQEEEGYQP